MKLAYVIIYASANVTVPVPAVIVLTLKAPDGEVDVVKPAPKVAE
jgi:hypothetical protein